MTQTDLWHEAASMAARAHRDHARTDEKRTPYFSHPARVALTLAVKFGCTDDKVLTAALLHDVLEDTRVDYDDLLQRFDQDVADFVAARPSGPPRARWRWPATSRRCRRPSGS
jgi:guanosine-3',5'-bis(diphosphate) 3'-pyrophosphohydrolase